jgi:hypothetical protein
VADVGKLRALGFTPSTSLQDGLRELVAWGRQVVQLRQVGGWTDHLFVCEPA